MTELFDQPGASLPADQPPDIISKAAFAAELGVAKSRITQLVAKGLPLTDGGKVPRRDALDWYQENIDPNRRKALTTRQLATPKARLDAIRSELAQLELDRARGDLIDRKRAEKVIFERARAERDALLGWAARVAPTLATEIGADPAALFSALDREVRTHLAEMAETAFVDLRDG